MSVSTLYRDPGKLLSYTGEYGVSYTILLTITEAPGEECDFKVLLKREKGGLRRYGRWHLGDRGEGTTIKATLSPLATSTLQCEPAKEAGQAAGRGTVLL